MTITSKPASQAYRDNYDRVFRLKRADAEEFRRGYANPEQDLVAPDNALVRAVRKQRAIPESD